MAGSGLSYQIGKLKILELPRSRQAKLGPRFDIRAFHDEILSGGSLPLNMLEARVDNWIRDGGRRTDNSKELLLRRLRSWPWFAVGTMSRLSVPSRQRGCNISGIVWRKIAIALIVISRNQAGCGGSRDGGRRASCAVTTCEPSPSKSHGTSGVRGTGEPTRRCS